MDFVLPMAIMALLKIFLTFRLILLASKFILTKKIKLSQFRLYEGEFPDVLRSARYQFQNMFEIPMLLYPLCLAHIILGNYNQFDLYFVWGFVLFRIFHFFIRLQNQRNLNIRSRTATFLISLIFLLAGWIKLLYNSIAYIS